MKFTILGYNQAKLMEFGLDVIDAVLLRYFVDFKDSGTMVKETIEGDLYYWLKYEGIMKELPMLNLKKDSIYRRFKNMAEVEILKHRTIKSKGVYSYYNIGSKYLSLLSDSIPIGPDYNPKPSDYNPEQKINLLKDKSIKNNNIYSQVIDYLNKAAGTKYKASNRKTKQLIKARVNEGFSLGDFCKVIDNKASEWMNTNMEKYLRPQTLFGPKFEGYLNQRNRGEQRMEALNQVLKRSKKTELDSACNNNYVIPKCEVCGEAVGIAVKMSFGTRVYPRACRCRREAYERQQMVDMNKQKQIRLKQIISNSMMNKSFRECTLENWNHQLGNENLYNIAKKYIAKFPQMKTENKGMLIYGEPGNGKTYFSACIANDLVKASSSYMCWSYSSY
ncbi:conserved phage C-terminal domain-containing protein [Clostridium magnum]|uniref:Phage conserved hypothetical protein C-terminal domain-containing protein n=1 Tax=Clostridium magnum DSM 2767 TaxID=1121326 RepID=A0A161X3D6_9CLOT|nr:conserved phage C-terminal domain-containing protein [Clostridium magnum]KZL93998.1 hypothetical protein CLMAG_10510 [Clostridium magnum DSM 2767]SHI00097.1 phage conserved hypothetical protein, C-terminal domain-containing protein [Clostridium magnum DSM 2767]